MEKDRDNVKQNLEHIGQPLVPNKTIKTQMSKTDYNKFQHDLFYTLEETNKATINTGKAKRKYKVKTSKCSARKM